MIVALKYDRRTVDLDLPDGHFQIIEPLAGKPGTGAAPRIREAFDRPMDRPRLREFLANKRRLLLVVSDATRRTGLDEILPALSQYFIKNHLTHLEIKIIIATGIHREPTPEEWAALVPAGLFPQAERIPHRAGRREEMHFFGRTSFGTDIWLNRAVDWADALLVCGGVGYHYFAGFSGGRKSLLPGLAWERSVKFNHNLVFRRDGSGRHPGVRTGGLEGNPVHLDMMEAMARVGLERIFMIHALLDGKGRLAEVVAGHPVTSFYEACRRYQAGHSAEIPEAVDLVVASAGGAPRDINMIQSHKTVEMARYPLRPGGTLVVLAACREGMGHPSFFPWFRFRTEIEFQQELIRDYVVNGQTALALFEKAQRYRIILVSDLPPADVRRMSLIPAGTAAEALQAALAEMPPAYRGLVLPEAAVTLCLPGPSA
jgi:nickel-dependent lactate racemase